MGSQKCVVEGCNLEYDVVCSFSFYNANTTSPEEKVRQDWIEGAMHEESECLWRHVSLQLCGYHFELDTQGLWIDSPMLPELLTPQDSPREPTDEEKQLAEFVKIDHNYNAELPSTGPEAPVSRLNVRQLVDTLGYLSMKKLQQKQLWVVKVETDKAEASITQSEQVITKMQDPKQIIEIIPQSSGSQADGGQAGGAGGAELHVMDESDIGDHFVCEIAEEQEISMEEVKEIATTTKEWMVNIVPETTRAKYAFVKHHPTGKKKRHFTAEMSEITLQGDYENYYILPDADPSVGVEVTTSYEPEYTVVGALDQLVVEERPKRRGPRPDGEGRKRRKKVSTPAAEEMRELKMEMGEDWVIENNIAYEEGSEEYEEAKKNAAARVRRKNKKYLGYDFVT